MLNFGKRVGHNDDNYLLGGSKRIGVNDRILKTETTWWNITKNFEILEDVDNLET